MDGRKEYAKVGHGVFFNVRCAVAFFSVRAACSAVKYSNDSTTVIQKTA